MNGCRMKEVYTVRVLSWRVVLAFAVGEVSLMRQTISEMRTTWSRARDVNKRRVTNAPSKRER